ncbi:hypothetical protein BJ322DRAFT_1052986 [Thelephora terrestris]|uniref:ER membrane protein complex subunit 7 beta-sandwich domain-containing protein n=1 Tax=Thelephora terrestris TaxID=56493 RepID=A0A9P6HGU8_9AGAM|nr:hypothetical protein BJ322DRAFT_1052986 [Thelephora terrestris]
MSPFLFLLLLGLSVFSNALDLKGAIVWNQLCPDAKTLGQAKAILDDGSNYYASITRDGSFVIPDVPKGTYVLNIVARNYLFDQYRIDVVDTLSAPEARPYLPGTPLSSTANSHVTIAHPLKVYPRFKNEYFVPKQSFNVMGMLQNPMIMMMGAVGVMVVAMPYMMKNLDPEQLKEVQQSQARMVNMQSSITSGDLSGIRSMFTEGSDNVGSSSATPSTPVKNRGKKKR